jgi:transcriptional regulator with XRE-family HTH domain
MLRDVRESRGLTQVQLSQLSGVPQGLISQLESSPDPNPGWHTVRKLARALRVHAHDLFSPRTTPRRRRAGTREATV